MNMLKHLTRIILTALAGAWIAGCANYDSLDERITEIEDRVQSLTYIPKYSDEVERSCFFVVGGELKKYDDLTLRFKVKPLSAAGNITKEQVTAEAVYTLTKASAGDLEPLTVKGVTSDAKTGILTVVIDPYTLFENSSQSGLETKVSVTVTDQSGLYDIATDYVTVELVKDPGVLSYRTTDNSKISLAVFNPDGNENELLDEFSDYKFTVFSLNDVSLLELGDDSKDFLTHLSINKPIKIESGKGYFEDFTNLKSVDLNLLDIRNVSDLGYMFRNCTSLTSLKLSEWDTHNVTDMSSMFRNCTSLKSLKLSEWDTRNVTDMSSMFFDCSKLTSLDLSEWDTHNVTDMSSMFIGCTSLTSLDLNKWDTRNVTDMGGMFYSCESLTSLDLSEWDTRNVTKMGLMFIYCKSLTSLDMSGWDTHNVTNMRSMFKGCAFESLDLSVLDTQNVTNMETMFYSCTKLTSLDLSGWNLQNVTNTYYMFLYCGNLRTITMKGCDDDSVKKIENALTEAGIRKKVTIVRE